MSKTATAEQALERRAGEMKRHAARIENWGIEVGVRDY
jgi:hypothetical protein